MAKRKLRVLIIEDHRDTAAAMRRLLEIEGYSGRVAGSVLEAIQCPEEDHLDMIVSDLLLPDGAGGEAITTLRNRLGFVPAIAVTAMTTADQFEIARQQGFSKYIVKPIAIDALCEAIVACLGKTHPECPMVVQ